MEAMPLKMNFLLKPNRTYEGEPDYLGHFEYGDTQLSPLLVCRSWRAVALATPLLWNSIRHFLAGNSGYCDA